MTFFIAHVPESARLFEINKYFLIVSEDFYFFKFDLTELMKLSSLFKKLLIKVILQVCVII